MRPPTSHPSLPFRSDPQRTAPHRVPTARRRCAGALLVAAVFGVGCHHPHKTARAYETSGPTPPPPQVVTQPAAPVVVKPMPGQDGNTLPPPVVDPPIVHTQLSEEPGYTAAYVGIGKPRMMVFVNRTVTGELVPVVPGVGAGPLSDRPVVYLQHGQFDEAQAGSIDYELIENLLAENLAANGKVTMIAPMAARQRLTDDDVRDIQAGRAQMLGELASKLNADVLVQVTAHPSQQTEQGLGIRLVAEAVNTHGGQAIAFASADVAPPLTKSKLEDSVRLVANKLMSGMTDSWVSMAAPPPPTVPGQTPVPPVANPLNDGGAVPPPTVPSPVVPPPPILVPTVTNPPAANPLAVTPTAVTPPAANPLAAEPTPTVTPAPVPATAPATRPAAGNPLDFPPP